MLFGPQLQLELESRLQSAEADRAAAAAESRLKIEELHATLASILRQRDGMAQEITQLEGSRMELHSELERVIQQASIDKAEAASGMRERQAWYQKQLDATGVRFSEERARVRRHAHRSTLPPLDKAQGLQRVRVVCRARPNGRRGSASCS